MTTTVCAGVMIGLTGTTPQNNAPPGGEFPPNLPRRRLSRLALRVSVGLAEALRSVHSNARPLRGSAFRYCAYGSCLLYYRRPCVIFSDDAGMLFCSVGDCYPCLFARKYLTVPGWATRLLAACGERKCGLVGGIAAIHGHNSARGYQSVELSGFCHLCQLLQKTDCKTNCKECKEGYNPQHEPTPTFCEVCTHT